MSKSQGLIYIAIGREALEHAKDAAISVHRKGGFIDITVLTDRPSPTPVLFNSYCKINVKNISDKLKGYEHLDGGETVAFLKTLLCRLSPYDKTLYLDNDTRAVRDISPIWSFIDSGIGFSKAFNPLKIDEKYPLNSEADFTRKLINSNRIQYNSGMFLFVKSCDIRNLFYHWYWEWARFEHHENMSLTRILLYRENKKQVAELPCIFNDFYPDRDENSVIVHYINNYKYYL